MSTPLSSSRNLPSRGLFAVPALLSGVPVAVLAALWTPSAVWGLSDPPPPELSFTGTYQGAPTVASADEVEVVEEGGEAPAAPQRFEARPGNTQVRLEWAAPEDESITGYEVRQRVAGNGGGRWSGWRAISGSGALTTSHVVGKLTNGEKYLFQLRAVNVVGEGAASKRKGATPMGALTVAVGDGRMVEGDEGKKEMEFKVSLSGETVHDVKLQATATTGPGSTATATGARRDFVPLSQSVVFAAYGRAHGKRTDVNDLEQTVRVQVVGDHLAEGDESFQLRLDNLESEDKRVTLAGGGENTSAVGVIVDDDAAPVLAALADVTVTAGEDVAITAAATDADGDTIRYTWSRKATETTPALPQGTALDQARLTFTPTAAGVYTMTVTADDGHGNTATEDVTITVSATPLDPNRPTVFAVPGNQQVTLRWSHPGDAKITKWQVQQKTSSGSWGSWVDISVSSTNWPTGMRVPDYQCEFFEWCPSYRVTGLTNGTSYEFRIRSVAGNVVGGASEEVRSTPKGVTAPTLSIRGDYNVSVYYGTSLTWTVADLDPYAIVENAGRIREWIVEWRYPGSQWSLSRVKPHFRGLKEQTTSHAFLRKDLDLRNGTQVEFRVRAKGELRRSDTAIYGPWSNTVTVILGTPPKPTNVSASSGRYREVPLSWDNPGNAHIIRKYQYEQNGNGKWIDISGSGAATTSHTVTRLASGTAYSFRIRAVNGVGAGEASEPVKATPDLSSVVPRSPFMMLWTGKTDTICNVDDSQCDSTNYKSRGSQKKVWRMYVSLGRDLPLYKPTGLQIQYLRTDRLEEGPSEWIDTGWCLGADCDGPINAPWPGMVDKSRWSHNDESAHIMYEPVPYEISVRVRMVNAAGVGHASRWITFKGGESGSATYHAYDEGAQISVSDATVKEAAGAELAFTVTLDRSRSQRPQSGLLQVKYATRDGTATAGEDYTATSGAVSFAPGETEKVVKVAVLDDNHDEASETMELVLSYIESPSGVTQLRDTVGTGTITNTDPIPAAWLGRFGRTVADQALDAVSDRIAAERTPGLSGSLAGQELPHMPFGSASQEGAEVVSDTTTASDAGDVLSEAIYHAATSSDSMSGQDVLLGTNFSLSRGADATGGNLTFWGRAAYSGFDGKEGDLSLDGEVVTGLLGMDYARQRWMLGLAVSRSGGTGSYNGSDSGDGKIEASLTAGVPYGAWQATDWLKLWGALGYGRGEMTLKPDGVAQLKADLNWTMAAVGARAALLDPDGEGLSLDLLSDALWTRTTSEKVVGLAGTEADVTRLRLGLEGSWANLLQGGSELTPKFSLGARLDGGDAETGFGMELGGGVVWSSPGAGLSLDLDARTLLFHEADGLKDWGFSAGLVFDPQPESERGLSVTLGQDWGGEATGGIDALFAANPLEQRSGVEGTSRWTLEAAYGLPAFAGRFTGAPYVGLALAAGARDYTVGWRLTPEVTEQDITFQVKATRSESSDARPDHGVELDIRRTW